MEGSKNFIARVEVDGRLNDVLLGPGAKDGGMYIELMMRDAEHTGLVNVLRITCSAYEDGELRVRVSKPYVPDSVKSELEVYAALPEVDEELSKLRPILFSELTFTTKR